MRCRKSNARKTWHVVSLNPLSLSPAPSTDAITDDGQILVYFQKEALSHYQPPAEWAEAVRHTHQEKRQQELQQ